MRDTAALELAILNNYIRKENPAMFLEPAPFQTFRPSNVLRDKLLQQLLGIDISNVSCRRLKYCGELESDNRIVYGPASFTELVGDTQPGVPIDLATTTVPSWKVVELGKPTIVNNNKFYCNNPLIRP